MDALRETIVSHADVVLTLVGLVIGMVFGATVLRTNFCTMGAISDIANFGDWRRMRAWLMAIAVALIGTQVLDRLGVVDLGLSMYLAPTLNWSGNILGGLMFGIGMVFAGGCASRNLARVGSGDLRALLTLVVLGIFAYMSIGGVLGPLRNLLAQATSLNTGLETQGLGDLIAALAGLTPADTGFFLALGLGALILGWCLADSGFRSSLPHMVSGLLIGLCVVAGWAVTGLAYDELVADPIQPVSLTFVRPAGDTLEWLMRYTALGLPGFGVATVFGTVVGAFLAAKAAGSFRLLTFSDAADTVHNLLGAAMMGIGGVVALGCTLGQAITGVSTLAAGSLITFAAIVIGGFIGIKLLERWISAEV